MFKCEIEALAVINDIKAHVKSIEISPKLQLSDQVIYLNLTTIENVKKCVELSANGFRVVGNQYNEINIDSDQYFETPYSLLGHLSPNFHASFANELFLKLNNLN